MNPNEPLSAAELIYWGDSDDWHGYITRLSSGSLYQLGDDIAELIHHPVSERWPGWRKIAGSRLGAIMRENYLRWERTWYHEGNRDVSNRLSEILESNCK